MAMTKEEQELREELMGQRGDATFDQNYLVEAGAGAGKTFTMVNRILRHLISGKCEPEHLVAITFTKKATEEMRGRLDDELIAARDKEAAAPNCDPVRLARLDHLIETSGQMQISTIHSFCQTMLAAMPFASPVGFDPQIGESETGACRAWFRNYWQTHPSCFSRERFSLGLSREDLEQFFVERCGDKGANIPYTTLDANKKPLKDSCTEGVKKLHQQLREALVWYEGELGIRLLEQSGAQVIWKDMRAVLGTSEGDFASDARERDRLLRQLIRRTSKFPRTEDEELSQAILEVKEKKKAADAYLYLRSHPLAAVLPELDKIWKTTGTTAADQIQMRLKAVLKQAGIDRADAPDAALIHTDLLPLLLMDEDAFSCDQDAQKRLMKLFNRSKEHFRLSTAANMSSDVKKLRTHVELSDTEKQEAEQAYQEWKTLCGKDPVAGILPEWDAIWKSQETKRLLQNTQALLYSWLAEDMTRLLGEYRAYKEQHRMAFSDDLLLLTRDMLRDSPEARAYFHRRYRAIYVDEFQDTDLVQTQLLFYLTADTFDPDWKKCIPAPGSLFLVGDPKQAIYRFRGADINTYKAVYQRFGELEPLSRGKRVSMGTSFRAAQEICDYVNKVFQKKMDGAAYQAAYAAMGSQNGPYNGPGAAGVVGYRCIPEADQQQDDDPKLEEEEYSDEDIARADAEMLADFIQTMVGSGMQRTVKGKSGPYRYDDFMILPHKTAWINLYMSVLAERGIPVNVTGKYKFRDFQPLARLQLYLEWLLAPTDGQALLRLLQTCYGASLDTLHRFCRYAQVRYLSKLPDQDLEGLQAVFSAERDRTADPKEKDQLERLLSLCGGLAELKQLRGMARTTPALGVIQRILESCSGLWVEQDPLRRRRSCSFVLQYEAKLRSAQQHSFQSMVRYAIDCLEEEAKQEVSLTGQNDCVRVMNLHQAKGLEAPVVILSFSPGAFPASHYLIEEEKGENVVYAALIQGSNQKKRASHLKKRFISQNPTLACPLSWDEKKKREKMAREAEELRLIYVAATRAAQLLLVNVTPGERQGSFWNLLQEGSKTVDALRQEKDWSSYGAALECLIPKAPDKNGQQSKQKNPPAAATVNGLACELDLAKQVEELSATQLFAITPSKLDHSIHAPNRKDRTEDEGDGDTQDADQVLDRTPCPKGTHWGTIIHSVMEQAVRHRDYTPEGLARYAQQAACDVLLDVPLTDRETALLVGEEQPTDLIRFVAEKAAQATAFFQDAQSPLRRLMVNARCCPELPFYLRVSCEEDNALYRHLRAHIPDSLEHKELDVQGVIDLAICKDDGTWVVVDYKTDSVREGETWETFSQRLRGEYTPQIASYAQVLERMGGRVERAVLCSIPLGGRLIELDLKDAPEKKEPDAPAPVPEPAPVTQADQPDPAPAKQQTAPDSGGLRYEVGELYRKGHFSAALQTSQGAHGFSLLVNGTPVSLTDGRGRTACAHKMCRRFTEGVSGYLSAQYPGQDCSVDFTNAGTVTILKRMLKMMYRVLPEEDWKTIQLSWEAGDA